MISTTCELGTPAGTIAYWQHRERRKGPSGPQSLAVESEVPCGVAPAVETALTPCAPAVRASGSKDVPFEQPLPTLTPPLPGGGDSAGKTSSCSAPPLGGAEPASPSWGNRSGPRVAKVYTPSQRASILECEATEGATAASKKSGASRHSIYILVVWKLDRLGRSLRDLVNTVYDLTHRGVGLKVLTGQGASIDTTQPAGKLVFGIFAALAEFERELISEHTKAGLASARARGRKGGARYKMTVSKLRLAMAAMSHRETLVGDLCRELGVTRQTLYRHVGPDGSIRKDGQKLLDAKGN